jgi:transposase
MQYTIKTLSELGWSNRRIARDLNIDRKTVGKIKHKILTTGIEEEGVKKTSQLETHKEEIIEWMKKGWSARIIYDELIKAKSITVSYSAVARYVGGFRKGEVYAPILTRSGEEAQVDFGYAGYFICDGKKKKIWVFCMVLAYSRYSYYEFVTDQKVSTFIRCHIHAFESFGGVPRVVRIDNLKAGVFEVNFYEAELQIEYHHFLNHYGCSGVTCRVRRGQEKGKVESGIKFVKSNFLKSLNNREITEARRQLKEWNITINCRIHGTTRKQITESFQQVEKLALLPLPSHRYEICEVEKRRVNQYGHISHQYNYYSVPYKYTGEEVVLRNNGSILKIYKNQVEIAVHPITSNRGEFITTESHKMEFKQRKSPEEYQSQCLLIGPNVKDFLIQLQESKPFHWHRMITGIMKLKKNYSESIIDLACQRALNYHSISYQSVKKICEDRLYLQPLSESSSVISGGFSHDLKRYDQITGGE